MKKQMHQYFLRLKIFSTRKVIRRKRKKNIPVEWVKAPDIHILLSELVPVLEMDNINLTRI